MKKLQINIPGVGFVDAYKHDSMIFIDDPNEDFGGYYCINSGIFEEKEEDGGNKNE